MVELKSVSKVYGKKQNVFVALDNISIKIPEGETVAIVGKSGSGKSTMMHIIGGLDHPTSGEVIINNQTLGDLNRKSMDLFRAKDLGFVFQSFFVEGNQSCYQNVSLPLEITDVPLRKRRAMIESALEQVELLDKINDKAKNLSGGQKQRLAIARAIVSKPKLIMADEPTGNLDSATGDKVIELLFNLNKTLGATLIIVTHDEELANQCKLRITMKDGKVMSVKRTNLLNGKSL